MNEIIRARRKVKAIFLAVLLLKAELAELLGSAEYKSNSPVGVAARKREELLRQSIKIWEAR